VRNYVQRHKELSQFNYAPYHEDVWCVDV